MKITIPVVGTALPLMIDVLGVKIPALAMLLGLTSVILVRIMLISQTAERNIAFWYYNVSLTILLIFITFSIIAEHTLGPGVAVMVGTGIGAGGMAIVDLFKERALAALKIFMGDGK